MTLISPTFPLVSARTYCRLVTDGGSGVRKETWDEATDRSVGGICDVGKLSDKDRKKLTTLQREKKLFVSGRALWAAGTEWSHRPENFYSWYNCFSLMPTSWETYRLAANLLMLGGGVGLVLTDEVAEAMPIFDTEVNFHLQGKPGGVPTSERTELNIVEDHGHLVKVTAGDSRHGWAELFKLILDLGCSGRGYVDLHVDVSHIRPKGALIRGFGGVAGPDSYPPALERIAKLATKVAKEKRKATPVELSLFLDEMSGAIVAGNIRRSAGLRLFSYENSEAAQAKAGLWKQTPPTAEELRDKLPPMSNEQFAEFSALYDPANLQPAQAFIDQLCQQPLLTTAIA